MSDGQKMGSSRDHAHTTSDGQGNPTLAVPKRPLRVLVCGGRRFGVVTEFDDHGEPTKRDDARAWDQVMTLTTTLMDLERQYGIACIIHGMARGADQLAHEWATDEDRPGGKIKVAPFKADWRTHGKAAGPIRNQRMIDEGKPDLVVAFEGGAGTHDMIHRARAAGLWVLTPGWLADGVGRAPRPPVIEREGSRDEPNPSGRQALKDTQ